MELSFDSSTIVVGYCPMSPKPAKALGTCHVVKFDSLNCQRSKLRKWKQWCSPYISRRLPINDTVASIPTITKLYRSKWSYVRNSTSNRATLCSRISSSWKCRAINLQVVLNVIHQNFYVRVGITTIRRWAVVCRRTIERFWTYALRRSGAATKGTGFIEFLGAGLRSGTGLGWTGVGFGCAALGNGGWKTSVWIIITTAGLVALYILSSKGKGDIFQWLEPYNSSRHNNQGRNISHHL